MIVGQVLFHDVVMKTHEECCENVRILMDSKNVLFLKASRNLLEGRCGFTVFGRQQDVPAKSPVSLFGQQLFVFQTDCQMLQQSFFCQRSCQSHLLTSLRQIKTSEAVNHLCPQAENTACEQDNKESFSFFFKNSLSGFNLTFTLCLHTNQHD